MTCSFLSTALPLLHRLCAASVLVAGVAAGPAPLGAQPNGQRPAPVVVETVVRQPMTQTMPVIGRVVTLQASVIASEVAGQVESVAVEVGDRVEQDAVVIVLALERLEAEVALREAELEQARARLESAEAAATLLRQNVDRLTTLQDSTAHSQARLDQATQQLAQAEGQVGEALAGLRRAERALATARLDLDDARVRAPFPGVVVERHVEVGEYVRVGDDILTLYNDRSLEIEAAVPADRISALSRGRALNVRFAGAAHEATVRAVLPVEDSLSRTRVVRLTPILQESARPAIGASVTVEIPLGQAEEVVTVHKDAIVNGPTGQVVFVVDGDVAEPRPVAIGRATGNRFEVLSGIVPGDLVVVRGNEELAPGQLVQVIDGGPPEQASDGGGDDASTGG